MGEIGWIVGEFFWVFFEILKYFSKKHQQIPCRYGRCAWFLCLRVSLAWRVAFFLVFWSCMRFLWQNCGEVRLDSVVCIASLFLFGAGAKAFPCYEQTSVSVRSWFLAGGRSFFTQSSSPIAHKTSVNALAIYSLTHRNTKIFNADNTGKNQWRGRKTWRIFVKVWSDMQRKNLKKWAKMIVPEPQIAWVNQRVKTG